MVMSKEGLEVLQGTSVYALACTLGNCLFLPVDSVNAALTNFQINGLFKGQRYSPPT